VATLNEVNVQLKVDGEREATQALTRFKQESGKLSTSVLDSARKIESINRRWKEAETLQQKNVISAKAMRAAQTQLAREYAVLNGMVQTYNRNGKEQTRIATNQAKAMLVEKNQVEAAARAQQQYAQRLNDLRMRLDPTYRASTQFKESLRDLIQAKRAGVISADLYADQVARLKQEFDKVALGGRGARRSMNNFNLGIQQVGYQVSDFAVQVQGGANPFVALSQQGSQLVGILPLMADSLGMTAGRAIALSSALAVAIPLLTVGASVFFEMAKGADDAADSVETFEDRIESLRKSLQDFEKTQRNIRMGFTEDEALGQDALIRAREQLRSAERAAREARASGPTVMINGQPVSQGGGLEEAKSQRALEEALRDVADAKALIARIEDRARVQREQTFAEEAVSLKQQLELQRAIVRFGADSAEVAKVESEQRVRALETRLREADIEEEKIAFLVRQAEELERLRREAELAGDATDDLAVGMDRVSQASQRAAENVMRIAQGIRDSVSSVAVLESENAVARRVIAAGGSESDARIASRSAAAGARVAEDLRRAGAGQREIAAAVAAATSAERRRLTAQAENRDIFSVFNTSGGGGGSSRQGRTASEYVAQLEREVEQRERLIKLSDEDRERVERSYEVQQQIASLQGTVSEDRVKALLKEEQRVNKLAEIEEQRRNRVEELEGAFSSFFMSVFDNVDNLGDAFNTLLKSIANQIYRESIADPLSEAAGGAISGFIDGLFSANGNAFDRSGVMAFANGGVVNRTTPFMFGNGGRLGIMGEAGPEAILPLSRGANGKLGVQSTGGGGSVVNLVVENNTGANANVDVQSGGNGQIRVILGAVARDIAEGGATYKSIRRTFQLRQPSTLRG